MKEIDNRENNCTETKSAWEKPELIQLEISSDTASNTGGGGDASSSAS